MPRWRTACARLRRRIPASLGAKLVAILTGVALVGAGAVTLLLALVITPGFDQLEQAAVDGHVERTRAVLAEYASKVEISVRDYGDWNGSYDYMGFPNRAFEEDSFASSAMTNLGINGMAYVTPHGKVVLARWLDIDSGRDAPVTRARMLETIGRIDFARALAGENSASFYVRLGDQIAAIGIAQVRRTDGSGPPRGHVVMARLLGSDQLSKLLQVDATLDLPHPVPEATVTRHKRSLAVAVPIRGADGRPVASAAYHVKRDLSALGRDMLLFAVAGTVLLLLVVMAVLSLMIVRLVLRPLHRVERHMGVVRRSGDLVPLTEKPRGDEIGSLVANFNAMLSQLKDLREQVEAQSFKLGQSESAVAVMHNVRNALNPVSTVLSHGLAQAPVVDRALLDRALAELADADSPPPARRQKLVAFVAAALEGEARARAERAEQMAVGRDAMQNVLEIIGRQQEQAHERPPVDSCDVTDIVARNATIARYSGGSSIAFHFPSKAHWALANRVLLSQVIGNLFANAAEAIAATGRDSGSIWVTIREQDGKVEITIRDDGEGFDAETGAKLFQRGFSTRDSKTGGLGLHWCANSMVAMGGNLTLRSDGRGTGARAVLTLQASNAMMAGIAA